MILHIAAFVWDNPLNFKAFMNDMHIVTNKSNIEPKIANAFPEYHIMREREENTALSQLESKPSQESIGEIKMSAVLLL